MMHAFTSELVKLNRKAMRWLLVGMAAVGVLVAVLVMTTATASPAASDPAGPRPIASFTIQAIEQSNGMGRILGQVGSLFGALALSAAASVVASEYSLGTWKNLFIREPRLLRLLGGKLLALAGYLVVGVLASSITVTAAATALAPSQGIDTSAWFTGSGLGSLAGSVANLTLSALAYASIGVLLSVLFRSPVAAIGAGLAYILPGETVLGLASETVQKLLPGQVFSAVSSGGTEAMPYGQGLSLLALYVAIGSAIALWRFRSREIGS